MKRHAMSLGIAAASLMLVGTAQANETLEAEMHKVSAEGVGESIGTVSIEEGEHGVLFTPDLMGLPAGAHGFHVHQNPSCEPQENESGEMTPALAAGGHYAPDGADNHEGPYGEGHLGDLPVLVVGDNGEATTPVLAPRLTLDDLGDVSLMVHEGGDNYSDDPAPLGGGGSRIACGIIEKNA
ncbi:superoxide dismutase family protein [Litchfieldella xinjiangensis]|uniref:superoxide dismutase family protein n=1 Tax=Litchfieldella xinjiangensis TaxID=1166948 RepID=UPI0005BDFBC0|nr:superoxide dismutase family protein [Halomonas xinjiangensis]